MALQPGESYFWHKSISSIGEKATTSYSVHPKGETQTIEIG